MLGLIGSAFSEDSSPSELNMRQLVFGLTERNQEAISLKPALQGRGVSTVSEDGTAECVVKLFVAVSGLPET